MNIYTDALTAVTENWASMEDSFDEVKQAAMNGDAEAQYKLGVFYHPNYDCAPDFDDEAVRSEGAKWLKLAAEQGHVEAQHALGKEFYNDDDYRLPIAPEEVRKWVRLAAEQGYRWAISCMIQIYELGLEGAQKDLNEAAKWQLLNDSKQSEFLEVDEADSIRRKIEAGGDELSNEESIRWSAHVRALVEVNNNEEVVNCYNLAASHPHMGLYNAGEKEFEIFNHHAGRCSANLQRLIGDTYEAEHSWVVKQNIAEAVRWYKLAAEKGDATAQYKLAQCFDSGQGIPQSDEDAAKWYALAAEQGHADAQNCIGVMYDSGRGVKQNYRTALKWFRCAAEQGEMIAQYNVGLIYLYGQGVKANDQKAARWFRRSSESGYVWGAIARAAITGKIDDLACAAEKLFAVHQRASLEKLDDCTLQLEDFDTRLKSLIERSRVPRGQHVWNNIWQNYFDDNASQHWVRILPIEARVAATLCGMLALVQEEPDEKDAKTFFELALLNNDPLAAYYLAEIANRNSAYDRALKCLDWKRFDNNPAYSPGFCNTIEALMSSLRENIRVNYEKEKTHKQTLSFLTHTLNNALSTGPETVRTVIDILGSDLYDQGQAEYKAINNMASLFPMFLFAESLLKTFKLYISDPKQICEKWKSDKVGDANVSLVIAMALRQSVARLVFSSNHLAQLKRLLPSQDKDAIKNIRKSFVDEIIPLEISVATASKVFDWINAHFSALRIEIDPDAEMAFTSNATRYMFFFAAFSELIYNALKYSDGREPIIVKWFRQEDDYCFCCVNSCQPASANQPLQEGSNKGLFFIDKLMSMLEDSRLNSQFENGEYRAMLQFGHENFGENIA